MQQGVPAYPETVPSGRRQTAPAPDPPETRSSNQPLPHVQMAVSGTARAADLRELRSITSIENPQKGTAHEQEKLAQGAER